MAKKTLAGTFDFNKMRGIFFFSLLVGLGVLLLYIMWPFFYPIFWAAVIAILFYPMYAYLDRYIKYPAVSSFISVILVIVLLFIPLLLISVLTVYQTAELYKVAAGSPFFEQLQNITTQLHETRFAAIFETIRTEWTSYAADVTKSITSLVFEGVRYITGNSIRFLFMTFFMLYTLYYFFKDGQKILKKVMVLSPLGDTYEKKLWSKFTETTRATMKSTVIVGGIQGILGGLLFWITGIPGAFIWGIIMIILSIIPAIGSFLVWFPAALIMLATGNIWQGILILLFGTLVISTIDNILRPILVGKDTTMHPVIVLFTTLGGIVLFGVSGFVIGPVVAALFLAVLAIYRHYYEHELKNN